jgi:ubiquinone biosynthesis protein
MEMNKLRKILILFIFIGLSLGSATGLYAQGLLSQAHQYQNDLLEIKNNLSRFLLSGIGHDDQTKKALLEEAKYYANLELSKLIDRANNPHSNSFNLIRVEPWDLTHDLRYLRSQISTQPQVRRLEAREVMQFIPMLSQQVDTQMVELLFEKENSEQQMQLFNELEQVYQQNIGRIKNLGEEMSLSPSFKLCHPGHEAFIKGFLNFYFQNLSDEALKNIVLDLMLENKALTTDEATAVILKNSGPGLGKLLQSLGKDPQLGASLAHLIEALESNNKAVPQYLFAEVVRADPAGHLIESIDARPLGTGTMAQVNKGHFKLNGDLEVVAVRILKPGIEKRAHEDISILRRFLTPGSHLDQIPAEMLDSLRKMIDPLAGFLLTELDIEVTKNKQIKAVEVYDRTSFVEIHGSRIQVDIHVPRLLDQTPASQIMIQEFIGASGKFSELQSTVSQRAISRVLNQVWFDEAIIESGFIHADLHQGNFSVEQISPQHFKVHLFDLGMADVLDRNLRRAFVLIGSGVHLEDAKLIARGFLVLNPDKTLSELVDLVHVQMTKKTLTSEEWILWGVTNNLIVSDQLGSLARGSNLVFQLSQSLGNEEELLTSRALVRGLAYNISKKILSFNSTSTLSSRDVLAIGSSASSKSCMQMMRSLMRKKH